MKLGLHLKLKQTLAPQLIQSLKMLQMPILKLEQTLRHELSVNPMLEELDQVEAKESEDDLLKDKDSESGDEQIDWDSYFENEENYKIKQSYTKEEETFERVPIIEKSLYEHLYEQLSFLKLNESEQLIGEYIIGNISPRGYLVVSSEEMASELELPIEEIDKLIKLIQKFDPSGVGSRDLQESLLIQLREKKQEDTLAYKIVEQFINELDKKSILQISRSLNVPFEKVQQALDIIKTLSPTPAYGSFDSSAVAIIPDLIIEKAGDEYLVFHNDRNTPQLRINPNYRVLLKKSNGSSNDTKKYVSEKLEQARWLLNSIDQRRNTMVRVMNAIIVEQSEFFEKGPTFLKPLIMEDIAQIVEMNVATISRVSNGKYV